MSDTRVLIVDDYELWRQFVDAALRRSDRWQPVAHASDAREAVERARLCRPDLILLDIGLPGESGIHAARRILAEDPNVKILFVSEHQSPELVEAALATGARGYVVKSHAGRELLPAMEAIAEGRRYLSVSLRRSQRQPCHHAAGFYADEAHLLHDYATFAEDVLTSGASLIVLSTASRRKKLEQTLRARGVDVDRLTAEGRHRWVDVADALSSVMVDDWPDDERFSKAMTPLLLEAAARSTAERARVAAWGECAPTLWLEGKPEAAIRVEQLWDQVARQHQVETLCSYSTRDLPYDEDHRILQQIRQLHSVIR